MLKKVWNKLSIKSRLLISFNAYKAISDDTHTISLLKNYAQTLSMMYWSELDKQERKILEKYAKNN